MARLEINFQVYRLPMPADPELADAVQKTNEEADQLAALWQSYKEAEESAMAMLRGDGLAGISYSLMQSAHARAIDLAIEIIRREHPLSDDVRRLLETLAATGEMTHQRASTIRVEVVTSHNRCSAFATRIKQHLSRSLFATLDA
ncbi:hypothetical protein SH449x_000950 [Pirellulaceae bacterium SH449]